MTSVRELKELALSRGVLVPSTAVLFMAAGAIAGYKYARHILEGEYTEQLEKELERSRDMHERQAKTGRYATPQSALEALIPEEAVEALRVYRGNVAAVDPDKSAGVVQYNKVVEVPKPERKNVFTNNEPITEREIENEIANRTEEAPYIISDEEFMQNEHDMSQVMMTYYEGDGVLADETDEVHTNIDEVIGNYNIPRFGHRSGEEHIVYIRNHILGTEFEVHRNTGKYSDIVAGV